jgi:ribosomal protein L37E
MHYNPATLPKRTKRRPKPPKCKRCGQQSGPLVEGVCAGCMGMGV